MLHDYYLYKVNNLICHLYKFINNYIYLFVNHISAIIKAHLY